MSSLKITSSDNDAVVYRPIAQAGSFTLFTPFEVPQKNSVKKDKSNMDKKSSPSKEKF